MERGVGSFAEADTDTAGGNTEASVDVVVEPGKAEIVARVRAIVEQVEGLVGHPVVEQNSLPSHLSHLSFVVSDPSFCSHKASHPRGKPLSNVPVESSRSLRPFQYS